MNAIFWHNMNAIANKSHQSVMACVDVNKVKQNSLTSKAIRFLFAMGGTATSQEIKEHLGIHYSAGSVLAHQISNKYVTTEKITTSLFLYKIREDLTLYQFGIKE